MCFYCSGTKAMAVYIFFFQHIIVGHLFKNIHPSLQYCSRSLIHASFFLLIFFEMDQRTQLYIFFLNGQYTVNIGPPPHTHTHNGNINMDGRGKKREKRKEKRRHGTLVISSYVI